ncbi:MAG: leucyl/phenylalanyl-tRNA--protein transferase [Clostridia bacterium]|nr:leucyl/phenylalanyl-tRNA--protein transferase [Clostridia bacterium]
MPVYRLNNDLIFPNPELADKDGLLAVGGDLSSERLLLAYFNGIFPWYTRGQPILWWSPDPRFVLFPGDIRVSKSMRKFLKKEVYTITIDKCFKEVMTACGRLRSDDTWITGDMIDAYCKLHYEGFAHSVETWYQNRLVGGLYGVSLGKCFFGESMFSTMDNASKAALITLSSKLMEKGFLFIDCQVYTEHLESMGAVKIPRKDFLEQLERGIAYETIRGMWSDF